MKKAILGRKLGMTQIFTDSGQVLPVTVIECGGNVVAGHRTEEKDGYTAYVLGYGAIKEKKVIKPLKGQFEKAGIEAVKYLREVRTDNLENNIGDKVNVDIFEEGAKVDATGISKGKGFAGGIKRHGFARGPMAHGSKSHREPGSTGAMISGHGGRVLKGKKLPGQMGRQKTTVQNLTIVKVDANRNLLLIKGAVPGAKNSLIMIKEAVKGGAK